MNEKIHLTIGLTEAERNMLNERSQLVQTGLRAVKNKKSRKCGTGLEYRSYGNPLINPASAGL